MVISLCINCFIVLFYKGSTSGRWKLLVEVNKKACFMCIEMFGFLFILIIYYIYYISNKKDIWEPSILHSDPLFLSQFS